LGIFDQHDSAFTFFAPLSGEIGDLRHTAAIFWCFSIPAVMGVGLVSPRILSDVKIYWKAK